MLAMNFKTAPQTFLTPTNYEMSARLSVYFIAIAALLEYIVIFDDFITFKQYDYCAFTIIAAMAFLRSLVKGIDKWFIIFFIAIAYPILVDFRSTANHSFLALYLLAPLALFPSNIGSETFSSYVRRSLGIVMIAAATQKLISGNFLNGHFLKYLASGGAINEMPLSFLCFGQSTIECDALVYISILSVVWQYAIGILLLINCTHILAFLAELIFVLGVGFVTDEMNFQAINVAALIIAFRVKAPPIAFIGIAALLTIDFFGIESTLEGWLQ